MTAKELIGMISNTNGLILYVPQGIAIQFLEECNNNKDPVKCTLIFQDNTCKIILDDPLNV